MGAALADVVASVAVVMDAEDVEGDEEEEVC